MTYTFKDTDFNNRQILRMSLRKIPGIGFARAAYLCDFVGLSRSARVDSINPYLFFVLVFLIKNYYGTDVFLKRVRENRLKGFLSFKSYKSIRYSAGLPIRGQHTHTNAKTSKARKFGLRRL